ncbi:MAG TPA: HAMP domain-containing sensor histidine kinase [Gemmatimonadaceae bacterium]|nr:HAMP domain-containing sensor histidine kinase [Gemmatimonadaceae bacterium]
MTPTTFTPVDMPGASAADAELAAAQRELASEHERLTDALARAESALGMRDEVLAIVAHDLRVPLTAVLTATALLVEEDVPAAERKRLLEVIRRAASGMNRLIQDLLDVAQMENGVFAVDRERFDLGALALELCEQFRVEANESGRMLQCEVSEGLPPVLVDGRRIAQVLENLISNALRFTPEGGRVTVRVARHGSGVVCSVADTGVGIAPDELPHLFERFWQARRYRRGGAGLGLAIARGVVEAHGSALEVRSELGRGSVFSFLLQ